MMPYNRPYNQKDLDRFERFLGIAIGGLLTRPAYGNYTGFVQKGGDHVANLLEDAVEIAHAAVEAVQDVERE